MLLEVLPAVGADIDPLARTMITTRLQAREVVIHANTRVVRLTRNELFAVRGQDEVRLPIETVVKAAGVGANRELPDSMARADLEIHVIGDALEPRKASDAVSEGCDVARSL